MSADNNDQNSAPKQDDILSTVRGELDSKLAEVTNQIKALNDVYAKNFEAIATQIAPKKQEPAIGDDDIYDPGKLSEKVSSVASKIAGEALAKERQLNSKIYELSQEFPEIQSDKDLRKAVLEMHNQIPGYLKDSPEGYEMAVLKAVAKAGLVPKSKRLETDEDVSLSSRGGSKVKPTSRKKVSDTTLMLAELMGRDINDEKVLKGLEEASNRDRWGKYR